ncbi:uncharacterized protein [Nicotiana tomentosiformis]
MHIHIYIGRERERFRERERMRMIYVCEEEEKEVGRKKASGICPYCGGTVEAVDIEGKGKLFCLPICLRFKRKYLCSSCSRRLVLYPS